LPPEGPTAEDLSDFRRILYGLDAILRLHFAQEEESYLPLLDGKSLSSQEALAAGEEQA